MSGEPGASIGAASLRAGLLRRAPCCSAAATISPTSPGSVRILDSAETLTRVTQRALLSPQALAREFSEADLSRDFKANGSTEIRRRRL